MTHNKKIVTCLVAMAQFYMELNVEYNGTFTDILYFPLFQLICKYCKCSGYIVTILMLQVFEMY